MYSKGSHLRIMFIMTRSDAGTKCRRDACHTHTASDASVLPNAGDKSSPAAHGSGAPNDSASSPTHHPTKASRWIGYSESITTTHVNVKVTLRASISPLDLDFGLPLLVFLFRFFGRGGEKPIKVSTADRSRSGRPCTQLLGHKLMLPLQTRFVEQIACDHLTSIVLRHHVAEGKLAQPITDMTAKAFHFRKIIQSQQKQSKLGFRHVKLEADREDDARHHELERTESLCAVPTACASFPIIGCPAIRQDELLALNDLFRKRLDTCSRLRHVHEVTQVVVAVENPVSEQLLQISFWDEVGHLVQIGMTHPLEHAPSRLRKRHCIEAAHVAAHHPGAAAK